MNILGIDTTTTFLNVIARTGDVSVSLSGNTGFRHGESLMPWIEKILEELALPAAELELIICALGPGSFTGLRIGLATAKGLALGTGCPIVGVPSLDIYGRKNAFFDGAVFPVIDARKNRFYTAGFEAGKRVTEYLDCAGEEILAMLADKQQALLAGPDCEKIRQYYTDAEKFRHVFFSPSAGELSTLIELGTEIFEKEGPLSAGAGPIYLRKSEAEIMKDQKGTGKEE
jgi:tRNA threonylcarbamoyladenosine biosynthesis protein TsaB